MTEDNNQKRTLFKKVPYVFFFVFLFSCQEQPIQQVKKPPQVANSSPLIALTPQEYNNSIRDLFGMPNAPEKWPALTSSSNSQKASPKWPWTFPKEKGVDNFEGMAVGQIASPYKVEQIQKASSYFANFALKSSIFFTCPNWKSQPKKTQELCAWNSIQKFAQRAWRRPMTTEEKKRLASFWDTNRTSVKLEDAIKLTVSGILQAPAFLFRVEQGNKVKKEGKAIPLNPWEMASRLSYFLWDSMPDQELFEAAAKNELQTREQIIAQTKRMLANSKARKAVVHFHNQLLGMKKIHTINPSRLAYGKLFGFSPRASGPKAENDQLWPRQIMQLRHSMLKEVELFVERTIFDGHGTFQALLTDNHGYMSSHTQKIYGPQAKTLPGPKVTIQGTSSGSVAAYGTSFTVTLSPAEFPKTQRSGLLTLPGVLALYAHPVHPSPILRGKFILQRLACIDVGSPPAEAFGQEPKDTLTVKGTNRERTELVSKPTLCASCHDSLNPPGFAFEHYDALGTWRDKDNGKSVDATATVQLGKETYEVKNALELTKKLATSAQIQNCYSLRWLRYALGFSVKTSTPGVSEIQSHFRKHGHIQSLLITIASSDLFRYRREQGEQ